MQIGLTSTRALQGLGFGELIPSLPGRNRPGCFPLPPQPPAWLSGAAGTDPQWDTGAGGTPLELDTGDTSATSHPFEPPQNHTAEPGLQHPVLHPHHSPRTMKKQWAGWVLLEQL